MKAKILAFAGSTRSESFNKKLIHIAAEGARKTGAELTLIDLRDFPLPLYDGDLESESGIPEHGQKLKALLKEHHGFLISSPEYNSSFSGVLKNVIDWTSRPEANESALACYAKKVIGLVSASPGALGGLRGLAQLRQVLGNINAIVVPEQKSISAAHEAFDENGKLKSSRDRDAVERVGARVVEVASKLNQE